MEDVYTIKIRTKPDTRNLYPSERRYSASTVSGLAWVHIALSATSFLLACLALVNPGSNNYSNSTAFEANESNSTEFAEETNYNYLLVLAPSLITVFGLAAGIASILASVKWYIDRNITILFMMSVLSTLVSLTAFILIATWFISTTEGDLTEFYKDKIPFKDFLVIKHADVVQKNESHMLISLNSEEKQPQSFSKRVLSINILIAAFLEFLWSLLSVKISFKGMRNNYKDDNTERRRNCISVVTKIKGNDARKLPRNGKIAAPKPDLIENYPSKKIKRIIMAEDSNEFFKNENNKKTDTSSEFYKERMMNYLNKCASMEGISNPEVSPSVHSEGLNPIPEGANVGMNPGVSLRVNEEVNKTPERRKTPVSWGDTPDHMIYNQNTLNLDKIFNLKMKYSEAEKE